MIKTQQGPLQSTWFRFALKDIWKYTKKYLKVELSQSLKFSKLLRNIHKLVVPEDLIQIIFKSKR